MVDLILPVGIGLAVTILFSFIFRNSVKVDKGFSLNYFKLSYRRKMNRTLINIPLIILLLFIINVYTDWSILAKVWLGLFLILCMVIQFLYNFTMWKKKEV
ncbi:MULTISPECIES: hypothetical protein [unclassified Sporosarcina]|uniref:hypothetical protein n=1 Tax=unclassified Sporosarcina TaxID=2647733 RepID=UPI00204032FD|nr:MULTISPECIES: hypothetical protein [unclassified Sporosarcina]GKV67144.1 hypothetical protein NCCP2331_32970 [Sporosarcina sp. NCCP-2331]GLB57474.1 hypothetical protein NCCP2378_32620 [Sporosarcina sp. NCCP-2378]